MIACQNTNFEGIKTLFDISLRLMAENSFEIQNDLRYISFLSLVSGENRLFSAANIKWKEQIQYLHQHREHAELSGINGEPIEFEWNISQDSHRSRFSDISRKI